MSILVLFLQEVKRSAVQVSEALHEGIEGNHTLIK